MSPRLRSLALLLTGLAAAGCGGTHRAVAPPRPTLPAGVASQLATLSESVANALDTGDGCTALALATELQKRSADAIARGQVPPTLRQPLRNATAELVGRVQCEPQPPEKEHGKGKHKGHKHGEGD